MRTPSQLLLCLCIAAGLNQTAHANLLDQTFSATYYFPDAATPYSLSSFEPQTFVVGPGLESSGEVENVTSLLTDFSEEKLTITLHTGLRAPTWGAAGFNGVIFQRVSAGELRIATAALDTATTMVGVDSSRLSFSDSQIAINWNGLPYLDGQKLVIDFTFDEGNSLPPPVSPHVVPEPGTLTIVAAGALMGWTLMRRRRAV